MANNETLDDTIAIRIESEVKETFIKKSKEAAGKPYQLMLRELIVAFNEGRVRIEPTIEQINLHGELYNDNRK